jgi:ubiquinone biosynthesis protein UbiJ
MLNKILAYWINTISPQVDLHQLDDTIVMFKCSELGLSQSLYIHNQRIELVDIPERTHDLIIDGDPFTLLQFLGGHDRAKVSIEGDLALAVQLQQIIQTCQIDWQEWMSHVSHQLIPDALSQMNPCPTHNEHHDLHDKIRELEVRIEILEAKLKA